MEENQQWFLTKSEDGSVFGPVSFGQLRHWADNAQISPFDTVCSDESTWIKAPLVPNLGMDYLVEVSPGRFYGPTTLGVVRELLVIGEINIDTHLINRKDGIRRCVGDFARLLSRRQDERTRRTTTQILLQQRIRALRE